MQVDGKGPGPCGASESRSVLLYRSQFIIIFFLCVAKHAAKGYLLWPRCAVQSKQRPDVAWILALLLVYGFFKPLSSTVMEHLPSLLCIPGVICWFSSSLCANSFKNAKADSLTAELPRAKQKTLSTHTGVASDKVKCAINVYSHHFPPLCLHCLQFCLYLNQ